MKPFKLLFLCISAVFFSACSSISVRNAQILASSGSSATLDIADSYARRADNLEFYLEGEYILAGLKKGYSAPNKRMITKIDSLKSEMLERESIFTNFAKVYSSFANLAIFEDSDNIEESMRSLTAAVNEYSELTEGKPYFSKTDEDLAALSGRMIFTAYHKYKLKQASYLIRKRLQAAVELLARQSEKRAVIALEEEIERNRLKVTLALWDMKMGIPYDIIADHVGNYGLQVNRKETMQQIEKSSTGKMSSAIKNVIKFRHTRELRNRKRAYNATIEAIKQLITAHREFEEGEEISLHSLNTLMRTVTQYTKLLTAKQNEKK